MKKGEKILIAATIAVLAIKLYISISDWGISWPDEIYQSIEPAHKLLFGYGIMPWEFVLGGRNWLVPAFTATLILPFKLLSIDDPLLYIPAIKILFSTIGILTGLGIYKLGTKVGSSEESSAIAASFYLLSPLTLFFSHRALSENLSTLPLILGIWLFLESNHKKKNIGAALIGLSAAIRYQNGIFCVLIILFLIVKRKWVEILWTIGILETIALLIGLLDKLTWGEWFHSFFLNLYANKDVGIGNSISTSPFYFYPKMFFRSESLILATIILLTAFVPSKKSAPILIAAVIYIVVHSLIPHKELRFIIPAVPLIFASAAVGIDIVSKQLKFSIIKIIFSACIFLSFLHTINLKGSDLFDVQYNDSAWDIFGPVNRLLVTAGKNNVKCGIKVDGIPRYLTGGLSHVHKYVRLYGKEGPDTSSGYYDILITPRPENKNLPLVHDKGWFLTKLNVVCKNDPYYKFTIGNH